jgi:hypothetical protein
MRGRTCFASRAFCSAIAFAGGTGFYGKSRARVARIFRTWTHPVPSLRDEQVTIPNSTGHPSLTLRAGLSTSGKRAK